jgi:glutathione S-transferase
MDVALYHAEPASNSLKVLAALHEKGVAFTSHRLILGKFEQHDPAYLAVNPAGQVPTLVHDGRALTESTVINEYIDAAFDGPALRPHDPFGQAQMRIWTKFVDEVFRPALSFLAWDRLIPGMVSKLPPGTFEARLARIPRKEKRDKWARAARGEFTDHERESWRDGISEAADRTEAALEDHDWLVGDGFSLADIAVFAMMVGMPRSHGDLVNASTTPRIMDWLARLQARPGIAAALATP